MPTPEGTKSDYYPAAAGKPTDHVSDLAKPLWLPRLSIGYLDVSVIIQGPAGQVSVNRDTAKGNEWSMVPMTSPHDNSGESSVASGVAETP